jgi:hypothetical protein
MKQFATLFLFCFVLGACGGSSGGGGSTPSAATNSGTPPSNLTYPNNNSESFVSGASVNISPTSISGSTPITYSISPTLPTGLTLNFSTGVISGTPTVVQLATSYTITATNATGSFNATISIAVSSSGTPPSNLTYSTLNATYFLNTQITNNVPNVTGTVNSWTIDTTVLHSLPSGLNFNQATGVISGTPTTIQQSSTFTITAFNSAGSVSTSITIEVDKTPTSGILRWTIIDNYGPGENIYVNFWDETIGNYAWPGSNLIFTATPGSNTYDLSCTLGDLICYGADANTTELGFYWGVDILNNEPYQSCENDPALPCCHTCSNTSYSITLAN